MPNLGFSGGGYNGTKEARKDWLRFLRDLETRYYASRVAHLSTNCGYFGLIFGTIMANSPATVQSRLDVIDGHAYWQHPQFPGAPWDPVNWFVPNLSMVNTLGDDNTLAGLARQRIKGKPFVVTEFNHSQPNYYGSEAPLLLAAYGALQDWDGVWMFDYGHGQDGIATMGYARGFFDTAQHLAAPVGVAIAAPPAGTTIGNQATATYQDAASNTYTVSSNPVTTVVQQVASLKLTADGVRVAPPGGQAV